MSNAILHRTLSVPTPHRMFNERVDFIVGYYVGNSFRVVNAFDNLSDALERREDLMEYHEEQIIILENRTQLIYLI